jgi:hypothetical protein
MKKPRDHEKELDVSGRIILKWLSVVGWGDMDWIHVSRDRLN